jgi:hypothetical protein
MNAHLSNARTELERPWRAGGQPRAEDIISGMRKAIEEMLQYLEELDRGRADPAHTPAVQGSDSGRAQGEAATKAEDATRAETKRTLDDYGKKVGS